MLADISIMAVVRMKFLDQNMPQIYIDGFNNNKT